MIKALVCLHNYLQKTCCPNELFNCEDFNHEENDDNSLECRDQIVFSNFENLTRVDAMFAKMLLSRGIH